MISQEKLRIAYKKALRQAYLTTLLFAFYYLFVTPILYPFYLKYIPNAFFFQLLGVLSMVVITIGTLIYKWVAVINLKDKLNRYD